MTWALAGGSDLDKHVGHKIQVTGKTAWDSMDHGKTPETTSAHDGGRNVRYHVDRRRPGAAQRPARRSAASGRTVRQDDCTELFVKPTDGVTRSPHLQPCSRPHLVRTPTHISGNYTAGSGNGPDRRHSNQFQATALHSPAAYGTRFVV